MIQIVENFFTDKQLKNVQDFALNKAVYTPKFFPNTTEKKIGRASCRERV